MGLIRLEIKRMGRLQFDLMLQEDESGPVHYNFVSRCITYGEVLWITFQMLRAVFKQMNARK